ncbi:MAG: ribonuclease J [Azospirillaceae bacterium]|nr:ribonuclease J [Azospirillaceae bacterium]
MTDSFRPLGDAVYFLPLGGSGEIGLNLNLYGCNGQWLMVDLGISFGDDTMPGIDVIMPDPEFIAAQAGDLAGLVLTHAHEDHLGAVAYLWPRLKCPVYATPFTAAVLRAKLVERGLVGQVPLHEVPLSGRFQVGSFDVELVTMTHSIPEPNAVVIHTAFGPIVHSGDWKLDPDPIVGSVADSEKLRRLGDEGVLALICDSTNALVPGRSGSEAAVRDSLIKLFPRFHNRIAISCFATNVARLDSIARAAAAADRHVALVGRSLWRINEAARATGYLSDIPAFLTEHDAGYLPKDKVVLICTGSQGEPRSALARIAADDHPEVTLDADDVVIFSSREIPGNERAIARVQNLLVRHGVEIVTANDALVHVSGHPAQDELLQMYQWIRPRIAVPVHGEDRHQNEHCRIAEQCQVPQTVIPRNGTVIRLAPGPAEIVAEVRTGRLALDGKRVVPLDAGAMRGRQRMMYNGAAVATLVLGRDGKLAATPQVTVLGLLDGAEEALVLGDLYHAVTEAFDGLELSARAEDDTVRQTARIAVRRWFNAHYGKKPMTEVHLIRL